MALAAAKERRFRKVEQRKRTKTVFYLRMDHFASVAPTVEFVPILFDPRFKPVDILFFIANAVFNVRNLILELLEPSFGLVNPVIGMRVIYLVLQVVAPLLIPLKGVFGVA